MGSGRRITLVSHGPNCLDGLTCAVVAARYFAGCDFQAIFSSNRDIDDTLLEYNPDDPAASELWITDISWRETATDRHLNALVEAGAGVYWVDHHKSALDRREEGGLDVSFTDHVLDMSYAASRLLFNYLRDRAAKRGESKPGLLALENLVMLADDVDRWILARDGSRRLALAVRAMEHNDAYRVLLSMDSNITYGHELTQALEKAERDMADSLKLARSTRVATDVAGLGVCIVAAECVDYAGEIADNWKKEYDNAVFALFDRRSGAISLRRTPSCQIDLASLASRFDGGGHAAAAGCTMQLPEDGRSTEIAIRLAEIVGSEGSS
ncbi:MAG: DHHA1 domain-containing protein [Deltaproteobacteria bacterium]